MGFHPYPFKWRAFRHFTGLLVMILRHMRKARELDAKIAQSASKIESLRSELDSFRDSMKKRVKRQDAIQRQINIIVEGIGKEIDSFCDNVERELNEFKETSVDNETLLYKGVKYLKHVAELLLISKKMKDSHRKELLKEVVNDMESLEGKAKALELQAKHLQKKVMSTVVFSQISPWGNELIERRIRVDAIEINQLNNRLKSEREEDLFKDFRKEIVDIYEIGRNANILMGRLEATFNSMRAKLKDCGISYHRLNKTQRIFKKVFDRMEKIGIWLENEVKKQTDKLSRDIRRTQARVIKFPNQQLGVKREAA